MQARHLSQRIVLFASLAMLVSIPLTGRTTPVTAQDTATSQGGLWITRVTPTAAASNPFDTLEIQFSSAVAEGTFTLTDVTFTGPGGTITPAGLIKLADDLYELDSTGLTGLNEYSLTIGPNIQDASAHSMDQDHDGTPGEAEDAYVGALFAAGVTISGTDTTYEGRNLVIYGNTATIDGSHSFASVEVLGGATLAHSATTADTEYRLELTLTDSLLIGATAKIDVSHRGYLVGGTDGNTTAGGATGLSGGSHGGLGWDADSDAGSGATNQVYGDYRHPDDLGSGGGSAWSAGGSGGGAVHVTAGGAIIEGEILANGGHGGWAADPAGSGGSIWLDVGTLSGMGSIAANGGNGYVQGGSGGGGRVAVYYDTLDGFDPPNQVTAHGGSGGAGAGAVGTVYLKQDGGEGQLRVESHGATTALYTPLGLSIDAAFSVEHLVISGTNVIAAPEHEMPIYANKISIFGNGSLSHRPATITDTYSLRVTVTDTLLVSTTGAIDLSGRGYLVGRTTGNSTASGATGLSGGSHGGLGWDAAGGATNQVYGDYRNPDDLGSGGGSAWGAGGSGGGLLHITADTAIIEGSILANGGNGGWAADPAGSGGSVRLNVGALSGSGAVAANGGNGYVQGGSGGAGRVAVYAWDTISLPTENITAGGGSGGAGPGEDGSVHLADAPHFVVKGPANALYHSTEQMSWELLGVNPSGVTVDLQASGDEGTEVLGADLPAVGSLDWDTTAVADGQYELIATFYDSSDVVLGQGSLDALVVNNAITWHSGTITGDETWAAGEMHVVEGELTVASGVTLTLEAGVVVKFARHAGMTIEDGAVVYAPATAGAPIVLTSLADDTAGGDTNLDGSQSLPLPGDWDGFFIPGTGQFNLGEYVELRYVRTTHYGTLGGDETWLGDFMHVVSGDLVVPTGATLTIQPGAVVKFYPDRGITVQSGGQIIAQGYVAQPILLTSMRDDAVGGDTNRDGDQTSPEAGDWISLYINGGQASLDHVYLSYGGGSTTGVWNQSGMLRTGGDSTVDLSNSVLSLGFYDGALIQGGTTTISNCLFTGHDRGLVAWLGSATANVINSSFDDNRIGLLAHGGTLDIVNSLVTNSSGVGIERDINPAPTVRYTDVWSPGATDGNYKGFTDPTGSDGNISADPLYKDRDQGNYRLNYGSPAIDAADGTAAPASDFMGAPRYDDPRTDNTGVPTTAGEYADMGAYEFVETAESNIDLVVTRVEGPATATVGDRLSIEWTVTNTGTESAVGPWHDEIFLVHRPDSRPIWTSVGQVLVAEDETLGPGQSAAFSAEITVPGAVIGDHYWQLVANAQGEVFEGQNITNNATRSREPFALDLTELVVDGPTINGQFATSGESHWYKIDASDGQDLLVSLDLASDGGVTELYLRRGYLPSRQRYDAQSGEWEAADVSLSIADSVSDVYYLLVYSRVIPEPSTAYNLTTSTADLAVTSASPEQGGTAGDVTLVIQGHAFPEDASSRLIVTGGMEIVPASETRLDSTRLVAIYDLSGAPAGPADVRVQVPGDVAATLEDGFEIVAGGAADFWFGITGPPELRAGRQVAFELSWGNQGTVDAPLYLLNLLVPDDVEVALSPSTVPITDRLHLMATTCACGEAVIPAGSSGSRTIWITPGSIDELVLELGAVAVDYASLADAVIDWSGLEPIVRPEEMDDQEWQAFWSLLSSKMGTNWLEMLQVLAQDAVGLDLTNAEFAAGVTIEQATLMEIDKVIRELGWDHPASAFAETGQRTSLQGTASRESRNIRQFSVFLSDYAGTQADLVAVATDYELVGDYLQNKAQVVPGRQRPLFDKIGDETDNVNATDIISGLQTLARETTQGEVLMFYYSGHGGRDGLSTRTVTVTWQTIFTTLNQSAADKIVVLLDACHSGAFVKYLEACKADPACQIDSNKWIAVTSSTADETTKEDPEGHDDGGWFTRYYLEDLAAGRSLHAAWGENKLLYVGSKEAGNYSEQHAQWFGDDQTFKFKDLEGSRKDLLWSGAGLGGAKAPAQPRGTTIRKPVKRSGDPNEKRATGAGEDGYVAGGETILYTIYFENDPEQGATAPAQEVLITDTLGSSLDWSTFELTTIGIGEERIILPAGLARTRTIVTLRDDPYPVEIVADLDPATGLVSWILVSIDPVTLDLPEDPAAGFLPVNDETGRGEGFVSFRIQPLNNLRTGDAISNKATIIFDPTYGVNPPIITNQTLNTIDADPPSSSVSALPAESPSPFTVSWSGEDGSGSGVAFYEVYVSTDGGSFLAWRSGITETQATFTGTVGSTYRFYSVATDQVGHRQATPAGAQATVTIIEGERTLYLPLVLRE